MIAFISALKMRLWLNLIYILQSVSMNALRLMCRENEKKNSEKKKRNMNDHWTRWFILVFGIWLYAVLLESECMVTQHTRKQVIMYTLFYGRNWL